ncbi:MAG: hypothetical protein IJS05_07080 [Paludibacteraceae bacterium]|nr:hypothetical protein [Paludibacteraceae bacterium]
MKSKVFMFIMLCNTILCIAQQESNYYNNSNMLYANKWYAVSDTYNGFTNEEDDFESVFFSLKGDTIIEEKTYQCFWKDNTQYLGAIRYSEDSIKLYYYAGEKEYLLQDFTVEEGDTISAYWGWIYNKTCVEYWEKTSEDTIMPDWKVTSIQYTNDNRKIVYLERIDNYKPGIENIWIQGIGTVNILFPIGISCIPGSYTSYWTVCAAHDDEILYSYDLNHLGLVNDCPSWKKVEAILINIDDNSDNKSMYNILGQPVDKDYRGIVIQNGRKYVR